MKIQVNFKNKLFLLFIIFLFSNILTANSSATSNTKFTVTESKTEVAFSGESSQESYENVENTDDANKNGTKDKNVPIETIVLIAVVIGFIVFTTVKIMRTLPSFKTFDDYQKEQILKRFIEYDNGDENLYYAERINGLGTGFYTVRTFTVYNEKIKVLAKMPSVLFIPVPFVLGYLVCYNEKRIICSISKEHFKKLRKEIQEMI